MQVSTIFLQYPSKSEDKVAKSIVFAGDKKCEVADLTFEELIRKRKENQLPCLIVRVKDIAGKVHLFDGCAALALEIFKKREGFFLLNNEYTACATVQLFELKLSHPPCHSFTLKSTDNYAMQHANEAWSQKRGHVRDVVMAKKWFEAVLKDDPNNTRALLVLGQIYEVGAKACFERVLELEPENMFAKKALVKSEEKDAEVVAEKLQELAITTPLPPPTPLHSKPKPKRNECGCALQ